MNPLETFELQLADGSIRRWSGRGWEDAAFRCADATGQAVVAWRRPAVDIRVYGGDPIAQ